MGGCLGTGRHPLHEKTFSGSASSLQTYLNNNSKVDINLIDGDGQTALHFTPLSKTEETAKAKILLEKGADPNLQDFSRYLPAHSAAQRDKSELLATLIGAKSKIDAPAGWAENTVLHEAAQGSSLECAKVLVEAGANVNATNAHGETPLHLAADVGNIQLIEFLLSSGSDPAIKTTDEATAYVYALDSMSKNSEIAAAVLVDLPGGKADQPASDDESTPRPRSRSRGRSQVSSGPEGTSKASKASKPSGRARKKSTGRQ